MRKREYKNDVCYLRIRVFALTHTRSRRPTSVFSVVPATAASDVWERTKIQGKNRDTFKNNS